MSTTKKPKKRTTEKPRNGGQWTEARYRAFVISGLRRTSQRWGPKHEALKRARRGRGLYECACCGTIGPKTLPPEEGKKRRRNNAVVDHIQPIVSPVTGFTTWDDFVENLYCEVDNLQVLCYLCNRSKTEAENQLRRESR